MAEMATEYTDLNNKVHKVEHITADEKPDKEQLTEELYRLFLKAPKQSA